MNQTNPTQLHPSTSAEPSAAALPQAGDDVMRIIADVESQMQRIRNAQKTQDDALAMLAQRTRALEQAEAEAAQTRQQLARERESLQSQQQALETERRQVTQQITAQQDQLARQRQVAESDQAAFAGQKAEFDRTRAQFESTSAAWQRQARQSEDALRSRETDLQREKDRLGQIETQCRALQQELTQKKTEFETSSRELNQRVDQAERNVGELIARLETSDGQLAQRQAQVEKITAESRTIQRRVRDLERLLHESTERADQAERDTAELAKLADQQRTEVESRLAQITQELQKANQSRDAALAECESAREQAGAVQDQLDQLHKQLSDRESHLADIQKKFDLTTKKLSEFAVILAEQTPQLERGAAAMLMVEQQQQQIERLARELAEYKLRVDPAESQRRDQRIVELTEALRQARGQSAGGQGMGELEQRNAYLQSEVNSLKIEVEKLTLANEEAQKQLKRQVDTASAANVHEALIAEHDAKVAALNAEIEKLRSASEAELQSQLDRQSKAHEQRLAERHKADVHEAQALRDRISELERELTEVRLSAVKSSGGDKDHVEASRKLREKAEKITAVAEHMRRRRTRLQRMRQLLVARSVQGTTEVSPEQSLALDEQKQQIIEARRALADAEKEMLRRWARPRAVTTMVWIFVLAAVCGIAGWMLADHLFPARIAASVVLEARTASRSPLEAEQATQWTAWHKGLLYDSTFMQVLAKRLGERRLDRYASPQAINQRMSDDLTIDASQKGAMILTLAGTDDEETTAVLDVIAATAAAESVRHHGHRNDSAWAVLPGERNEAGRARFATLNSVPISDERFKYAGVIFAVLFTVCMAFIATIYTRLLRAKRVFEQEHSSLFSDARLTAT